MKRSPFNAQRPPGSRPPRPAKQIGPEYTLKPRPVAAAVAPTRDWWPETMPKRAYVRDTAFREMCRGMACKHCGAAGDAAGVTWAHSNQGIHGHGRGIKASDQYVAALCWNCHRRLDQGHDWSRAEKVEVWTAAYRLTVALAVEQGTWPKGYPVPIFDNDEVMA